LLLFSCMRSALKSDTNWAGPTLASPASAPLRR
jgi:hypothetical protein